MAKQKAQTKKVVKKAVKKEVKKPTAQKIVYPQHKRILTAEGWKRHLKATH
jgi:hypothetical protein